MSDLAEQITNLQGRQRFDWLTATVISSSGGNVTLAIAGINDTITVPLTFGGNVTPGATILCAMNGAEVIPIGQVATETQPGGFLSDIWETIDGDLHPRSIPATMTVPMSTSPVLFQRSGENSKFQISLGADGSSSSSQLTLSPPTNSGTFNLFLEAVHQPSGPWSGGPNTDWGRIQHIGGLMLYTNGGAAAPVWLGSGGDEAGFFTSPIVFDIRPSEPNNALLNKGQGCIYRETNTVKLVARNSSGTIQHLTLGTLA